MELDWIHGAAVWSARCSAPFFKKFSDVGVICIKKKTPSHLASFNIAQYKMDLFQSGSCRTTSSRVTSDCVVWRSEEEPAPLWMFSKSLSLLFLPSASLSLSVCDKTVIGAHGSRASSVDGERRGPSGEPS